MRSEENSANEADESPSSSETEGEKGRRIIAPTPKTLAGNTVHCTICQGQINVNIRSHFAEHPFLEVIVCKRCSRFLSSGEWKQDDNGADEFCKWCGQGGELYLCDACNTVCFCKNCIRRNFGRRYIKAIVKRDWTCFICDPTPLNPLKEQYRSFVEAVGMETKKRRKAKNGRASSGRPQRSTVVEVGAENSQDAAIISVEGKEIKETSKLKSLPGILKKAMDLSTQFKGLMDSMQLKLNDALDSADMDEKLRVSTMIATDLTEIIGTVKEFCNKTEAALNGSVCIRVGVSEDDGKVLYAWVPKPNVEGVPGEADNEEPQKSLARPPIKRRPCPNSEKPRKKRRLQNGESSAAVTSPERIQGLKDVSSEEAHADQLELIGNKYAVEPDDEATEPNGLINDGGAVSSANGLALISDSDSGAVVNSGPNGKTEHDTVISAAEGVDDKDSFHANGAETDFVTAMDADERDTLTDDAEGLSDERSSPTSVLSELYQDAEDFNDAAKNTDVTDLAGNPAKIDGFANVGEESTEMAISKKAVANEMGSSLRLSGDKEPREDTDHHGNDELSKQDGICSSHRSGQEDATDDGDIEDDARAAVFEALESDDEMDEAIGPSLDDFCDVDDASARAAVLEALEDDDEISPTTGESLNLSDRKDSDSSRSTPAAMFEGTERDERTMEGTDLTSCATTPQTFADDDSDKVGDEVNAEKRLSDGCNESDGSQEAKNMEGEKMCSSNTGDGSNNVPASSTKPKNPVEDEEGFDPGLQKQIEALKRGLRLKNDGSGKSKATQKPHRRSNNVEENADDAASAESMSDDDDWENTDADMKPQSPIWLKQAFVVLTRIDEDLSARDEIHAALADHSDSTDTDQSNAEDEPKAAVSSKKKKDAKPPCEDEDGSSVIMISSGTEESEEDVPKSKLEIRCKRLLRDNFGLVSDRTKTGDASDRKSKSNRRRKRQFRVASGSEDEISSSSDTISENDINEDDDYIELIESGDEREKEVDSLVFTKPKEELSLSQGSLRGSPAKGNLRRNIRPVTAGSLATQEAQAAERERRKRIAQLGNSQPIESQPDIASSSNDISGPENELFVELEKDADPPVRIHSALAAKLKPHQIEGVKFMYTATIESVKQKNDPPGGCILGHCMGLGKTFQVIAFLHSVMLHPTLNIRTALVVAPVNVVLNWKEEFRMWLRGCPPLKVFELLSPKNLSHRLAVLNDWQDAGGVLIVGYDLFRTLVLCKKITSNKMREQLARCLLEPGPDIVICDEGHKLKNEKTGISVAMSKIRTKRRICLTGTPLQNNLTEYHCMVQFIKPNLLGTLKEFKNQFENPIKNGQCVDSTAADVRFMKRRAHVLHSMLEGFLNRLDYSVLTPVLPQRHEFVLMIRLSEKQIELYQAYLKNVVGGVDLEALRARNRLFSDFHALQRICTHPLSLQFHLEDAERQQKAGPPYQEPVQSPTSGNENSGDDTNDEAGPSNGDMGADNGIPLPDRITTPPDQAAWWKNLVSYEQMAQVELSGKLIMLMEIIWKCEIRGDKLLVFSQSLVTLNVIEKFLGCFDDFVCKNHNKTGEDKAHQTARKRMGWAWIRGKDYFRMDGLTNAQNRKQYIERFNDEEKPRLRLFLISTRAGGIGTNLVGANRVVIFDASWNPSNDAQAIFRVYRYGQTKPVFIYRFVSQGTMEDVIYDRQVTKQSLALRVVDEHQIERHFNANDLEALYNFDPANARQKGHKLDVAVPKDQILGDLLLEHNQWLITYHEHDSLLRNLEEEKLSEEEKNGAWKEFEAERQYRKSAATLPPLVRYLVLYPALQEHIDAGNILLRQHGMPETMEGICEKHLFTPGIGAEPAKLVEFAKSFVVKIREAIAADQRHQAASGRAEPPPELRSGNGMLANGDRPFNGWLPHINPNYGVPNYFNNLQGSQMARDQFPPYFYQHMHPQILTNRQPPAGLNHPVTGRPILPKPSH